MTATTDAGRGGAADLSHTNATLEVDGRTTALPVREATEGPAGFDLSGLLTRTGHVTLDAGYANTASCTSALTYIDGEAGILRYRGYPIEQLAEQSTFLEVAYLLIQGELPTPSQLADFTAEITTHTLLREEMRRFFDGFPRDAHPMAVLSSAVSALSTFYQDSLDPLNPDHVQISTIRLLAKLPTIASYAYKTSIGQALLYPDNNLSYVENFLRMTFGVPTTGYQVDPDVARVLDMLLLLHADHEQNCSAATVRVVGSSQANLFASVSAGVNALFGPAHGGANQATLQMLQQIRASGADAAAFVRAVKDGQKGVRLMGFGHRVYRNYDPRAAIVKRAALDMIGRVGKADPLLDIALDLERIALSDDYFTERKLYPNVDFYTGLIYRAIGFPTKMFPVLFAIGRLPGWIAQWREMMADPMTKIARPRQIYIGPGERPYVDIDQR